MNASDLHKIMPLAGPLADEFAGPLNAAQMEFGISSKARQASFLSQIAHESGQLRSLQENLNYSADGLMKTWPSRFPTREIALEYARQPEKIANKVYANRMGNGDEASGDGWRFRGASLIQLTGKDNQSACARNFNIPLCDVGDWLRTPIGASRSAAWFWRTHKLNELADKGDQTAIRKVVNGGTLGLAECLAFFNLANKVLV